MVTPPKLPANDSLPPLMRTVVMSSGLLAFGVVIALSLPAHARPAPRAEAAKPEPVLTAENAVELCRQPVRRTEGIYRRTSAKRRAGTCGAASCKMAFEANPANTEFKVAVARDLPYEHKTEAIAMLREAAAQGNADAYYEIYEHHSSWDRGDLDKVQLITRAEAARALRKAAELGHAFATQVLARRLEDGDIVKRDMVAARYWAERSVANPAKDASKGDLLVTLGSLLATSDKPDERERGLEILEGLARPASVNRRQERIGAGDP